MFKQIVRAKWQLVGVLAATLMSACWAAPEADRLEKLLNTDGSDLPMPSDSYSGYLTVNEEKHLHYIFVASESDPKTDPILLWFNGGPGCSSLLGFMQEHGPWVIEDGATKVTRNPYPWTARANVLYLESPAGVGFSSWKVNKSAMFYNDMIQSEDAYTALKDWYAKFPEYGPGQQNNPLFISGESYGGIYTPYLAWQIYQNNKMYDLWHTFGDDHVHMNLKGFIVGNGATDWTFDVQPVFPELVKYFDLIPESVYQNWTDHGCTIFFNGTVAYDSDVGTEADCYAIWQDILDNTASLNWYDLYRKNFTVNETHDFWGNPLENPRVGKTVLKDGREMTYKRGHTFTDYVGRWNKHHPAVWAHNNGVVEDNGLTGDTVTDYFNNQSIKDLLHIKDDMYLDNDSTWEDCNGNINQQWHIQNEASLWIYRVMYHQHDIKMLFFSGDTDGAVPALGTRRWLEKLGWEVKKPWTAWVHDGEVQGYIEHYRGHLDFATVRGVGHMAPQWKRGPMQYLISQWIHGQNITVIAPPLAPEEVVLEW